MNRNLFKCVFVVALLSCFESAIYANDSVSIQLDYSCVNVPKGYNAYVHADVNQGFVDYWSHDLDGMTLSYVNPNSTTGGPGEGEYGIAVYSNSANEYFVKIKGWDTIPPTADDEETCTVAVVEVNSVSVDTTIIAVGDTVTFTASENPYPYSLTMLQWQRGYSENGTSWTWESVSGSKTVQYTPSTPGYYKYRAKNGSYDSWNESDTVTAVGLELVTVDANATQTNVTGDKNWAAVKDAGEYVIVGAVLNPDIPDDNVPDVLVWEGGSPCVDNPRQCRVSKSSSGHTTVTGTVGTTSDYVDIWIIWAEVEIRMDGQTPDGAVQFGYMYDGTENLGAITYNNGHIARGKVIPIGTITPPDVHEIIDEEESGFKFYRWSWIHYFKDGEKWTDYWEEDWTDDTSDSWLLRLKPNDDDQIFDNDAPSITGWVGVQDSAEANANFRQWVEWNDEVASDMSYWHWVGRWKIDESPQVTYKDVNEGLIQLPDENENVYDPPD